ncbi:hypothetical protein Glove_245g5 [Diversispora epigaea]|uniref:Uncharacterized protein n=1 Tax=Diversispora epigaea TaxID=1348612 RepID=A0A397IHI3_9GLOM|nr:hypothetical protein Glove_245g5 [Diversispora epigaea]
MSNHFQFSSVIPEPTEAMIEEAKIDYALRLYHYTQLQLKRMKFKQHQPFHHHSSSVLHKRSHINKNPLSDKRSNSYSNNNNNNNFISSAPFKNIKYSGLFHTWTAPHCYRKTTRSRKGQINIIMLDIWKVHPEDVLRGGWCPVYIC